jgi:hypothetical protein
MLKFNLTKPNFKGFTVDNAHANWNVVHIVYGSRDASVKMVDKERTCLFHWTQLLDRHTKQLIALELQEQHMPYVSNTKTQHLCKKWMFDML